MEKNGLTAFWRYWPVPMSENWDPLIARRDSRHWWDATYSVIKNVWRASVGMKANMFSGRDRKRMPVKAVRGESNSWITVPIFDSNPKHPETSSANRKPSNVPSPPFLFNISHCNNRPEIQESLLFKWVANGGVQNQLYMFNFKFPPFSPMADPVQKRRPRKKMYLRKQVKDESYRTGLNPCCCPGWYGSTRVCNAT